MNHRYDDAHRGPGVLDAIGLAECWMALMAERIRWPEPPGLRDRMLSVLSAVYPEDDPVDAAFMPSRAERLNQSVDEQMKRDLGIGAIIEAIKSGRLPIWVAPIDGPDRPVPPASFLELGRETIIAGCYRPYNDRGWLFGRPLFVKSIDWADYLVELRTVLGVREERAGYPEAVQWCRDWLRDKKGNGMDAAWKVFQANPAFKGLTRDDVFRPAWTEAKTKNPSQP